MTTKLFSATIALSLLFASCTEKKNQATQEVKPQTLSGSYRLLESKTIKGKDTTIAFTDTVKTEMFKMFNDGHFAFFNHDKAKGKSKDSLFVAGGGTYSLDGTKYEEHLQYCSAREWENNVFKFELTPKGDTLIQKGEEELPNLKIKQTIIETYVRITH